MREKARQLIDSDCRRYLGRNGSHARLRLEQWGFRYTTVLRKVQAHPSGLLHYWYRLRLLHLSRKTGFQIGAGAQVDAGLFIGHRGTVGVPSLGNRVWVGSNAVIVGNVRIGNDVLVAPNAYVNFDVPDHSIVIGNPARVIHRMDATEGYCHNLVPDLIPDEEYSVREGGER